MSGLGLQYESLPATAVASGSAATDAREIGSMSRRALACLTALIVVCAALPARAQSPTSCTTAGENVYVRNVMADIYLWYAMMPNVDPTVYDSPEAFLEAVRYKTLDSHFSYITSRAANDAFFSDSQFIGFGLSTSLNGSEMRVLQVFPDSPALEAGLSRGDRIVEIGGRTVAALVASGEIDSAFGPSDIGVEANIAFVDQAGTRRDAHMVKRLVTIPTVSLTKIYNVGGRRIAYIFFRNFVTPSFDALDTAFADLAAAGVDDLVLDLRYNGGGLVNVAQYLAGYIGGKRTDGLVFAEYFHNDKNTFRNRIIRFETKPNALTLNRLIVVTTNGSASASELVINALRPFIPVTIVGSRTYGKPVGQYGIEFCDKLLAPVSFALRNADGQGDFFDGFPPDCAAPDDADHQLGDTAEASLKEALTFATTNACSPRSLTQQGRSRIEVRAPRALGWQSLVNAY
jgi:carboxyl-terminal processing protease